MNTTIDNTKLVGVIRSLSRSERNQCRKFLESPYFNTNKDLIKLFEAIDKLLQKDKPLDKYSLWKKLRKETYNDVRFRKYCSDLSLLLERFIAQQAFESNPIQQKHAVLEGIKERKNIEKFKQAALRKAREELENYKYRDTYYYLKNLEYQRLLYNLEDYGTQRTIKANIEEIFGLLGQAYFGEALRIVTDAMSRTQIKEHQYDLPLIDDLINLLDKNIEYLSDAPQIVIYYRIYKILRDYNDETSYYELKKLIELYSDIFPRDIAIDELYGAAQNYCIKRINQGNKDFTYELFDLFQMLINNDLLIHNGQLSPWYFRNIIFIGLRLGKYKWTEKFINDYQHFLPEDLRENAVTYNLANLYFYQKRYDDVVNQLRYVEYDDLSYNLNSKNLLLATYYELDEFELLESHLDAFDTFLKRRKDFTEDRKILYRDLIKFTRRLIRLIPNDQTALDKLKQDVLSKKSIANANWLLQKIAELEK